MQGVWEECVLVNRKSNFGCDGIRLVHCAIVVAMICAAKVANAQIIEIERTVSTSRVVDSGSDFAADETTVAGKSTDRHKLDGHDPLQMNFSVQAATFTTTDPTRLFGEHVVYLDPSQEPVIEESNEFLPSDLSIPPNVDELPADDELLEQPITLPAPQTTTSNRSSGCAEESIHNFNTPEIDDKRLKLSRLMQEPYSAYRSEQSMFAWMPGHGENFGWFDWQ